MNWTHTDSGRTARYKVVRVTSKENDTAYQTINPAIGEMLKTFPEISGGDLEAAVVTRTNVSFR